MIHLFFWNYILWYGGVWLVWFLVGGWYNNESIGMFGGCGDWLITGQERERERKTNFSNIIIIWNINGCHCFMYQTHLQRSRRKLVGSWKWHYYRSCSTAWKRSDKEKDCDDEKMDLFFVLKVVGRKLKIGQV